MPRGMRYAVVPVQSLLSVEYGRCLIFFSTVHFADEVMSFKLCSFFLLSFCFLPSIVDRRIRIQEGVHNKSIMDNGSMIDPWRGRSTLVCQKAVMGEGFVIS